MRRSFKLFPDLTKIFHAESLRIVGRDRLRKLLIKISEHKESILKFGGEIYMDQHQIDGLPDPLFDGIEITIEGMTFEGAAECFVYLKDQGFHPKGVGKRPEKLDKNHQGPVFVDLL
jgi:hypothetical protein